MPARSEKIRESDPGITVGGKPLDNHLEKEERNELEESQRQEVGAKAKSKKKIRPKAKFEDDPARVSKRVRRLSDWEIRKEYGVKEKPFSSLTKNVMYCIFNAGDTLINSRAISDELGRPLPDVSSSLSNIYKKLKGDGMIYRKKTGLAYNYCLTNEGLAFGFEELYQKYFPGPGGVRKKPKEEPAAPPPAPKGADLDKAFTRITDLYSRVEALAAGVFKRIEALEQDGLADKVEIMADTLQNQSRELGVLFQKFDIATTQPDDDPDYRAGGDRELNVNFNIRFLFG